MPQVSTFSNWAKLWQSFGDLGHENRLRMKAEAKSWVRPQPKQELAAGIALSRML